MKYIGILMWGIVVACSTHHSKDKKITTNVPTEERPELIKIAEFRGAQVTGVTTTSAGRMFANFPRWRENLAYSVVEVFPDGSSKPYPNAEWNKWKGRPQKNHFTCVQSVVAHGDNLYVLDPSSPMMEGVVGKATLYEFDLATNSLKRSWAFDHKVAPKKSYLNDLRVDDSHKKIYITDSGLGGIVVLDLETGKSRRVLDNHASTKAENVTLLINGKAFIMKGKAPKIHSDGIALSPDDSRLYYHSLTGYQLYSVPTDFLSDENLSGTKLAEQVESRGVTPAPDGMIFDSNGNLYMADLERNAVAYRTPAGEMKILVQDSKILWPDTFTIDRDQNLIFTDSLLSRAPAGSPADGLTFTIYKVALPVTK